MPGGKRGLPLETTFSVVSGSTCARSSRQARSRCERVLRPRPAARPAERAEHGDTDRAGVEPLRVRADHVALDHRRSGLRRRCRSGRRGSCSRCRSSRSPARGRAGCRARSPAPRPACSRCWPAVWWTTAKRTRRRVGGLCRAGSTRRRSRPTAGRSPARRRRVEPSRGTRSAGLQTVNARTADRRSRAVAHLEPVRRPTHHGLPSRHGPRRPRFGAAEVRQVLAPPAPPAARRSSGRRATGSGSSTLPEPRQWSPTSVNGRAVQPRRGLARPAQRHVHDAIVAVGAAAAGASERSPRRACDERRGMAKASRQFSQRCYTRVRRQGRLALPDRILTSGLARDAAGTTGARWYTIALCTHRSGGACVLALASPPQRCSCRFRARRRRRRRASSCVEFDNDVNPVTQDYLAGRDGARRARGIRGGRDRDGHAGRARRRRCGRS